MRSKSRTVGALGAALALATAAACTDDSEDGGGAAEGQAFDEASLIDMVNESARLQFELETAESRIVQNCLELQGFTVHDPLWFNVHEPEEQEALYRADDWGSWLPELEEASEFGLGVWAATEGADADEVDAYFEYKGYVNEGALEGDPGTPSGGGPSDDSAFDALDTEQRYDWYVAYFGEATAAQEYGHLTDADTSDDSTDSDGAIDLGGEFDYVQPEPGGCQREMIDALYGDLRLVEDPEGGEYRTANWSYRPPNPMDDFATIDEANVRYREAIAEVQGELVDCLAEHGHPGWEFGEEGSLPLSDYLYELYEGTADVHDHPDLPEDAPTDFEGKKAFEIAFAVELAECGDETGFRDTAEQAWSDSRNDYYLSIETAVYAWQEEIRGILTKAQEAIEG
ncbi:MAG TPA: hypothetical protein VHG10_12610 [Glycomyces sp.]|nr:hypothetical protein [Glycomyces sp.]